MLRGRLMLAGAPLADAQVTAGTIAGSTDAQGLFVLDHLPPGVIDVKVDAPPLAGRVELPAGPCDLSRDVTLFAPDFATLRLERVPQGAAERTIADWLSSKRLGEQDAARLERLAALVALAPDFRLAMLAPPREVPSGARAAALLQRYLTGPALVPRERLIFAVAEFARPGHLGLILTRLQEPR
ncbi:MAG: carboxypeptidase regulatory-like domain-containing protein [Deltaproteobacteria bacterium]|nr:MAG: carboxypeptidase regulatory-like domain-containing protein [Deltaproteobacteria bacterium]